MNTSLFHKTTFLTMLLISLVVVLDAQKINDFFWMEKKPKELPVRVRGNLDSKRIILFVQGGFGEHGLDFAAIDYWGLKKHLEANLAMAYYDQRGLHTSKRQLKREDISYAKYSEDILRIAEKLKERYKADIWLMGHSYGGVLALHFLSSKNQTDLIKGAILVSTPYTADNEPDRYTHFRPTYLRKLAKEKINEKEEPEYWQKALNWINEIDSIHTIDHIKKWNAYVDYAKEASVKEKKLRLKDYIKATFSRPYAPFGYELWYRKNNDQISDWLWEDGQKINIKRKLASINQPILLLSGRFDSIAPPIEQDTLQQNIPIAEKVIIPNAAHSHPSIDNPKDFFPAILDFISKHK
jgi:pimeloyl-ACP methyl ester carboxylesterase